MKIKLKEGLETYLPDESLPVVMGWLNGHALEVRVARSRRSKLGDYRPPVKDHLHRISVNKDLNPYEFLLTLTHEIAHMLVWDRYRKRMKPHGKAWKAQYASLVYELVEKDLFPDELKPLLIHHITKPRGSSKGDGDLIRGLHAYNPGQSGTFLEDLPENAVFSLPDGRMFIKLQKLRKWYRCQHLENKRFYRISPVTRVTPEKTY